MKNIKQFASRRISSYSSSIARAAADVKSSTPSSSASNKSSGPPKLPEDVWIIILCQDLGLKDLVSVSEVRRLVRFGPPATTLI
ncbi:hypothetical protein DL93DRAFT_2077988 [Clavulina sp. PMI_390]|nr:hypothetical protein DL93DRAFT_2077988 [Clavulina sp. PMI_390]